MKCAACGLVNVPDAVVCRRCGASSSAAPIDATPPAAPIEQPSTPYRAGPSSPPVSCVMRANVALVVLMGSMALFFLAGAFNEKLVRGGFRPPGLIFGLIGALGAFSVARPRRIVVERGEIVFHGAFGVTRFPVEAVREVSIHELNGGRSGIQYSLRFELDRSVRARPYLFGVPNGAKPDDDLGRVLQAIAEQSAAVTFDHAANRIRLGHRAFR